MWLSCYLVVYYHVPTSNHNLSRLQTPKASVVYYHVPTSNHNITLDLLLFSQLYIIMFLHQTTTKFGIAVERDGCILSCSYIKPQHTSWNVCTALCCILSCSYIKPQPIVSKLLTIRKKQSISLIRNGYVGNIFMQIY